jgi:tetratricopeptide (TPR) repeat protein
MNNQNRTNSQPQNAITPGPPSSRQPKSPQKPNKKWALRSWLWIALFVLAAGFMVVLGALMGYQSGTQAQEIIQTRIIELTLEEQYNLGVQDLEAGRYEVARQRFEYILKHDPSYPDVTDKLAQAMAILYATATPTPPAATPSPTPTRDLRPVEEMFAQAQAQLAGQDWNGAIDTLIAMRKENRSYQAPRVDGMLFISLRYRGMDKIWKEGNLEGGLYDLSLAENFGPLDVQANSARELARLYMIGSSFWEVHPEQAVYYFGQVAAAAPGLRDASGWTASERYRASLIQYGDLLASQKDWCQAQEQYELAYSMGADATLQATIQEVALKCSPPSPTPELTTETPTPTATGGSLTPPALSPTPTATQGFVSTATSTNTPPAATPTPTQTTVAPPATATPTETTQPTPVETEPYPAPSDPLATETSETLSQGSAGIIAILYQHHPMMKPSTYGWFDLLATFYNWL